MKNREKIILDKELEKKAIEEANKYAFNKYSPGWISYVKAWLAGFKFRDKLEKQNNNATS